LRGSVRREILLGAEASETVAGSYELSHGWVEEDDVYLFSLLC